MYKKSIKTMPRRIKQEVVKCLKSHFDSIDDIISISNSSSTWDENDEKSIVTELSKITCLPSYWIITSKKVDKHVFIVFEKKLGENEEAQIDSSDVSCYFNYSSFSWYYGIY